MMNNKMIFSFLIGATIVTYSNAMEYYGEKIKTATSGYNFTFEIKNKGKQPFYLTILRGDGLRVAEQIFIPQATNLQPGYLRLADLPTYPSLTLILEFLNTSLTKSIATYTYDIHSEGTPVFISWDGAKIVPQMGSYWGLSGYTESGIPISTNVEPQDIELVEVVK
jgi:hypothetical protein